MQLKASAAEKLMPRGATPRPAALCARAGYQANYECRSDSADGSCRFLGVRTLPALWGQSTQVRPGAWPARASARSTCPASALEGNRGAADMIAAIAKGEDEAVPLS
eukprot:s1776_g11.t1